MKYRHSKLGVAWSVLMPLGLAIIVGGVYSLLFDTPPTELIPLIFASINPWNFLSGSADAATMCFPAAEGYIKQSAVSSVIFPIRTVMTAFVTLLYSVITFFAIYLFMKPQLFGPVMFMCVPGLIIMFIFALGLANMTSVANLYVRDFAPMQGLILQGLFYATPIIYNAQALADRGYSFVYEINPFYYMLEVVRKPMMGSMPDARCYVIATAIAALVFVTGVRVQIRSRREIVYLL